MANFAVFFLCTGRCGTQWFADNLEKLYQDNAVVTHEPLGPHYNPKKFYRKYGTSLDEVRFDHVAKL